jgi:hypothetical protein
MSILINPRADSEFDVSGNMLLGYSSNIHDFHSLPIVLDPKPIFDCNVEWRKHDVK